MITMDDEVGLTLEFVVSPMSTQELDLTCVALKMELHQNTLLIQSIFAFHRYCTCSTLYVTVAHYM